IYCSYHFPHLCPLKKEDSNFDFTGIIICLHIIESAVFQRRKQPFPCFSVCLGLLCALLLAGNIGQFIFYETISSPMSANPEASDGTRVNQLQSSNDSFNAEIQQLEARMTNLTKEKDQLQQSFNSLTTERDEFKNSLDNLKTERDQCRASYNASKEESDPLQTKNNNSKIVFNQLQSNYTSLNRDKDKLQSRYNTLDSSKNQLQISYNSLRKDKEQLQTNHNVLIREKDQLQSNYRNLKTENDKSNIVINQLQANYTSLKTDKDQLYNSLAKDKEQLQIRYNTARTEKEQLKTNYSSLAAGRDQLQEKIDNVRRNMVCQRYWNKFDISCYYVSTLKKNWTMSRLDCIARGGDLVIIDSREEQVFVHSLLKPSQNVWIGLTDHDKEGVWKWVDGSPVTAFYWQSGQPNSFNGNQDCVELLHESKGAGEWNDDGCFAVQNWICEK
uniref:C-type lectin domain-containing protein n=1 Tax=Mola mola TaxID=94237 RepID=A0A3Q3VQN5_MOLML